MALLYRSSSTSPGLMCDSQSETLVQVYLCREELEISDRGLQAFESGLASDAEAVDVVDVSRALKEVIQQIAAVDSQLDAILIKERRPRGWRKEVGDLRVAKNELDARQDKLLEHLLEA